MLQKNVRNWLTVACQNGVTCWVPERMNEVRAPKTTSALPSRMGWSTEGSSSGLYSKSASCTVTTSPVAMANPV